MGSFKTLLASILALALTAAPLFPAAAATAHGQDAHAAHAGHSTVQPGATDGSISKTAPCSQHDGCNGQCCAACAQCVIAVLTLSSPFLLTHTVLSSTVPRLHDRLPVAPHDRPPAV